MSVAFHTITPHAIHALQDDVGSLSNHKAWLTLFWMYHHGRTASDYEIKMMHKKWEADVSYRICECCYGTYVMVIKRGVMLTCYHESRLAS